MTALKSLLFLILVAGLGAGYIPFALLPRRPQVETGLFAYLAARGMEQNGPPWDEYVTDPGSTPQAELRTNIYLPVK